MSSSGRRFQSTTVASVFVGLLIALATRIPASSAGFVSSDSSPGNAWDADTLTPPTAVVASGGSTVTVTWTAPADTYASGTRVYRSTSSGGPYTQILQVSPATTTSAIDSPTPGTYYYVLRSFFLNWESVDSAEVSALLAPEDFDGVAFASDNCVLDFNIDQLDTDGDGIGDRCDPSPTNPTSFNFGGEDFVGSADSNDVLLADLDGDGSLDIAFANLSSTPNTIWFNNGSGNFTNSGQSLGAASTEGIDAGDVDGDGDIDLIASNNPQASQIWLNNGSGTFSAGQSLNPGHDRRGALGDLDGDGDLDMVFVSFNAPTTVWFNNGSGVFAAGASSLGTWAAGDGALEDVDGDADLDLLLAGYGVADQVFVNDGLGNLTNSGQNLGNSSTIRVIFADFDADGDQDYVGINYGDQNSIWKNDGSGGFTYFGQTSSIRFSLGGAVGDLDGDGDLDIGVANNGTTNRFWKNNGSGVFSLEGSYELDTTAGIAFGDLDGDGDLDVVFAEDSNDTSSVHFNS